MQLDSWLYDVKSLYFCSLALREVRQGRPIHLTMCVCVCTLWKRAKILGKTVFSISFYWKLRTVVKGLLLVALIN